MEGQITVYGLNGGPCYRCMFPEPPPPHTVTNCSDGGVLGMVPGLIGNLYEIEIVKIILLNQFQQLTKEKWLQGSNQEPRNLVSAAFEKDLHGLVSTCDKILD